jgi:hypothetical protein
MPASRRIRIRLALAALGVLTLAGGTAVAGGAPAPPELPFPPGGSHNTGANDTVRFGTTGNHSELVETIPITTGKKKVQTVVMSLPPGQGGVPGLEAGDQLRVNAEVQPSTTCVVAGSNCLGTRYRINPFIRARLVLAASADPAAPAVDLAPPEVVHCTQRRPNRNHHCPLVFRSGGIDVPNPALPCEPDACYVNLLLSADHPKAKPGNKIVLGGDRPNGVVQQDKGRISLITVRNGATEPTTATDSSIRPRALPLHPRKGGSRKRVIHSISVPELGPGEILEATATYRAKQPKGKKGSGGKRRRGRHAYNAFIGSQLILADTPTGTAATKIARTSGLQGELSESNGLNCTQRRSGFTRPCFIEKAGAIKINNNQDGEVQVYLNLVGRSKPLLKNARRRDKVKLKLEGGLLATRYAPE